ncbi:hypothetical protein DYI23_03770 [Roseibium polysiphoniae]|uniref:Subtilase family protein n=1 Tax=Roseibium polysiphoniae TaxID=2571221 RepID=A0A944C8X6_9HYPH|nr:hypothetical protein [Roseibium polysiphoniae]MBS8259331.1 hypothetical protein [Roseibium polysiphoniae]
MYLKRAHEERIERYAGPYERWVFSEELGRPFAFPAIAQGPSGYYTALMEGDGLPQDSDQMSVRLPPLWKPDHKSLKITPFAFHDPQMNDPRRRVQQDTTVARMLGSARTHAKRQPAAISPRFRVNFPVAPGSWVNDYRVDTAPSEWTPPPRKPKAIIGVIDDALPFAHRCFLNSDGGTRISHCWLQSGQAEPTASVPFGREFVNAEIDGLRHQFPADERQQYRQAKATAPDMPELGNHLMRHATHGAHVLGLAAGNGSIYPDYPLDDDILIIGVQLPNTIAWDTSGFGKEMYMLSALHYIFERSRRIARHFESPELPLVVNFSYGWSAGRHDGNSEMEIAIEELLKLRREEQAATEIVMPIGNNFQSRIHGRFSEQDFDQDKLRVHWHLQPDDGTSSYLEMWLPEEIDPAGYTVTLTPPDRPGGPNPTSIDISPDMDLSGQDDGDPRRFEEIELKGEVIGQMSADKHRGNRWRIMIALIPTIYRRGVARKAPSGTWTVELSRSPKSSKLGEGENILIWLQRDDDPSDLKTHGRQSYLLAPENPQAMQFVRPKSPVRKYSADVPNISGFGATNAVAASASTTRVSGYILQSGHPSDYSGAGGVKKVPDGSYVSWGPQPEVSAVTDQSRTQPGIWSIGTTSGTRSKLIGTSAAAPSVARLMVRNAAAGRPLLDGFGAELDLPSTEADDDTTMVQHKACVGIHTAPPVSKAG